jgi:drug/metabolite transporter (DMT)-like permease
VTFGVFLAVMAAALIHASWNALVKTGASKQSAMLILGVSQALFGMGIAVWKGIPAEAAWLWLLGSGLIHMCYQLLLGYAYEHGDLSRVYPIARGTAPMIVLVASGLFLSDRLTTTEVAGVIVLGLGILLMVRGVFTSGEERRMLPYALGAAMATAGYSITDGMGARAGGDAVQYVGWLMMISAVFYVPAAVALKGTVLFRAPPRAWFTGFLAGGLSIGGYAIAVWAMTVAPIALVSALRETSILFAVLIGWLAFGEAMTRGKALAAGIIVAGVMLTRL